MVTFQWSLRTPNLGFQGHSIFEVEYLKNGVSWEQSCYRTLIGVIDGGSIRLGSTDLEWPWKAGCKESIFFRRILITLVRSATSLHLHICVARFVSDGWVSCRFYVHFISLFCLECSRLRWEHESRWLTEKIIVYYQSISTVVSENIVNRKLLATSNFFVKNVQ